MDSKNKKVLYAVAGAVVLAASLFLVKTYWCDKCKKDDKRDN